jgi:endonuclease YncB( thermonuclease family)
VRHLIVALFACLAAATARGDVVGGPAGKRVDKPKKDTEGAVLLNGESVEVRWTDGDSFKVKSGKWQGRSTRVSGYNTLESFGPVHRWGGWTPEELYAQAKSVAKVAAKGVWTCTTDGKADGYGRLLVVCPDLAVALIRDGQAMAYAPDGTAPLPGTVEAQAEAMKEKRGIWAKGRVNGVVTSVHSVAEEGATAYNRVVDTRTGQALKRPHTRRYAVCEEVCEETDGETSCMVYVPFERRYKHKPNCLKR